MVLLLAAIVIIAVAWYKSREWRPDESLWPDQGALIGASDGTVDFETLKGLGASFVYLQASAGAGQKDANFGRNLDAARAAGLQVGAVHEFDPCLRADEQSANFLTMVPREAELLPPAIRMARDTASCPNSIRDAAVQSELITLVNQIEMHTGSPVVLAPSRTFEQRFGIGSRIERALWLERDYLEPEYGARPWRMWTANSTYDTAAADKPLRWLVVRP
ncbi:glycoside hydrolase family 25 protein [Erythrobacter litoralis]|uniref:glycoside hydrolase family 25 protein n=1 Tax=Erythrobacter litoralis TaxID=39960 RepID=UPI0024360E34|nr:glycoside hydrolase family 25 protein [Erythrobacter litoralis]